MSIVKQQLLYATLLVIGVFLILSLGFSITALQAYYLSMSLVGGSFFAWDKAAARAGRRRIAEKTILVLGALGAGLVILLLIKPLRHKTLKDKFLFYMTLVTAFHFSFLLLAEHYAEIP